MHFAPDYLFTGCTCSMHYALIVLSRCTCSMHSTFPEAVAFYQCTSCYPRQLHFPNALVVNSVSCIFPMHLLSFQYLLIVAIFIALIYWYGIAILQCALLFLRSMSRIYAVHLMPIFKKDQAHNNVEGCIFLCTFIRPTNFENFVRRIYTVAYYNALFTKRLPTYVAFIQCTLTRNRSVALDQRATFCVKRNRTTKVSDAVAFVQCT
jgi:hypothetical protein